MHQEDYKGHQITVDIRKVGKGFRGSYQIDGGEIREMEDRPLRSEALAQGEALSHAKWVIDRMTA